MAYVQITSIAHLKEECKNTREDFFIHLGITKSSKSIKYSTDEKSFDIHHEIDDTWEEDVTKEVLAGSNIGEAIKKGNFYKY